MERMRSAMWVLLSVGALAGWAEAAVGPQQTRELGSWLHRLEAMGFAGAVMVAEGEAVVLHEGYGLANRATATPWSVQTVSTIGSVTKQFTGAAILRLAEQGRLDVRDTIDRHFEGVPADKRAITLHHLLTHSSGLLDPPGIGDFDPIEPAVYVERVLAQELAYAPGEGYEYANANYSLLGMIVEQLSGVGYEEFLRREFFEPLGMHDTGYVGPRWDRARVAQGYREGETWGTILDRPMAADGPHWALRANGGIHSTLSDMWIWCRALMEGRVLGPESMEAYWAPHVDEGGGGSAYAYGWVVTEIAGERVITHNGGNGIHFADFAMVPGRRLFLGLQTNVVADFRMANGLLGPIESHLLAQQSLPRVPDPVALEDRLRDGLVGHYEFVAGGGLDVRAEGDVLEFEATDRAGLTQLLSQREGDPARAARLSERIETIFGAFLRGDVGPIHEAYGGRVPREALEERMHEQLAEWSEAFGEAQGFEVLGTAFREDRDETIVRVRFTGGEVLRTYVWDPTAEDHLLGVSWRGTDPVLQVWPDAGGDLVQWNSHTGDARVVAFDAQTRQLHFGEHGPVAAQRTR